MSINSSDIPRFSVEPATYEDADAVNELWGTFPNRPEAGSRGGGCLVARNEGTGAVLGVAEYVRTFPPEDGVASVAVSRSARHGGVGTRLLRDLAEAALHNGIRNLGVFLSADNEAGCRLLGAAGIPVRLYRIRGGIFITMDLVQFAIERSSDRSGDPLGPTHKQSKRRNQHRPATDARCELKGVGVDRALAATRT